MSYERLYDANKAAVMHAITITDDRTTLTQARHIAHDTAFAFHSAATKEIRELPEVTLESVLFLFGERP